MTEKEICIRCGIPRKLYDFQPEPGYSNPDYRFGNCAYGHIWRNETIDILIASAKLGGLYDKR